MHLRCARGGDAERPVQQRQGLPVVDLLGRDARGRGCVATRRLLIWPFVRFSSEQSAFLLGVAAVLFAVGGVISFVTSRVNSAPLARYVDESRDGQPAPETCRAAFRTPMDLPRYTFLVGYVAWCTGGFIAAEVKKLTDRVLSSLSSASFGKAESAGETDDQRVAGEHQEVPCGLAAAVSTLLRARADFYGNSGRRFTQAWPRDPTRAYSRADGCPVVRLRIGFDALGANLRRDYYGSVAAPRPTQWGVSRRRPNHARGEALADRGGIRTLRWARRGAPRRTSGEGASRSEALFLDTGLGNAPGVNYFMDRPPPSAV
jgi:hypothetical protein